MPINTFINSSVVIGEHSSSGVMRALRMSLKRSMFTASSFKECSTSFGSDGWQTVTGGSRKSGDESETKFSFSLTHLSLQYRLLPASSSTRILPDGQ